MPELPEVETVRSGLASLILGSQIESVEVYRASCVRLQPGGEGEFAEVLVGARIDEIVRRGKFLWMPLFGPQEAPQGALSAHLGMSGQFRVFVDDAPEPHAHCRARIGLLRDGRPLTLDFLDQRTFGYLFAEPLVPTADAGAAGQGSDLPLLPASVSHIGRDALDPLLDEAAVVRRWRRGTRGIKQVLLDQTAVSGIGNIYADEALWLAGIHPQRPAERLTAAQARTLLDAVRTVMLSALSQGGTSFDALYVNVNGESGYFSRDLEAYGRGGEPCSRCGTLISRAVVGQRSTHWCARCQPAPRRQRMTRD